MQRGGRFAVAMAVVALTGACSSNTRSATTTTSAVKVDVPTAKPISTDQAAVLATVAKDGSCDELDATHCLLPFPSSRFQTPDTTTATKVRVHLPSGQLPNTSGKTLDVAEWNKNDGFSPGTPMLFSAADIDLVASKATPIGDIGQSLTDASATVLLDDTTGKRLAHWVEIDSNAPAGKQLVIIRPAAALPEGHRVIIGVRHLVDHAGTAIAPSVAFAAYRDNLTTALPGVESRRPEMEGIFAKLGAVGVTRSSLYLAWDFTVASEQSLATPMLTMRDDAFHRLGDAAPKYTADPVITTDLPTGTARRLTGTFSVPLYLTDSGKSGSRLHLDATTGLPTYVGTDYQANFTCQIPQVALDAAGGKAARPVVYGHGLLGSAGEAENGQVAKIASTNNMVYCATNWIGMSEDDVGNAAKILGDLSYFPSLPERSLQGILDALFLGRLMLRPDGLAKDPAFQNASGTTILDTTEVYFDGNSQGGIMGGAATAVAPDWHRAVLGVPGMDYALLLSRSVDFNEYLAVLRGAYPDPIEQQLIYPILNMLWDRAETNGYAQHLTANPYPGTKEHQVVLDVAFGDHQVSQYAAEMEARTIGAKLRTPALANGRAPDAKPFYGLEPITSFPYSGAALVYHDSGSLAPPPGNVTPQLSPGYLAECSKLSKDQVEHSIPCHDPHEDPRRAPDTIKQKDLFFRPDGKINDTCDAKPCQSPPRFQLDY